VLLYDSGARSCHKMADTTDEILKLLCSHVKLDRDRGVISLERLLSESNNKLPNQDEFEKALTSSVQTADSNWEIKHGGLLGAKLIISARSASETFLETMKKNAVFLMHDDEFRVRILAGRLFWCYRVAVKFILTCL